MLINRRFWRTTAWPTLFFTMAYLVHTTELQRAWQTWADTQGRLVASRSTSLSEGVETTLETTTEYLLGGGASRSQVVTSPGGNRSISLTDAAGRAVGEIFEGVTGRTRRESEVGYDAFGRKNYERSPRGLVTRSEYDAAGREVATTTEAEGTSSTERRGYDRHGRVAWTQTQLQQEATSEDFPEGRFSTYLYLTDSYRSAPPFAQTHGTKTATRLDDFDTTRALGVEDPRYGQIAAVFHEDSDRVAANNAPPPDAPALAFSGTYERYAYDARGRRVEVTKPALVSPQGGGTPALREVTTRTEYDDKDRVSEVIFAYDRATSPTQTADSNVRFRFTYGEDGAREKVIYPSGLERLFSEIEREIVHPPTAELTSDDTPDPLDDVPDDPADGLAGRRTRDADHWWRSTSRTTRAPGAAGGSSPKRSRKPARSRSNPRGSGFSSKSTGDGSAKR